MKSIITGILIGITISLGATVFAQTVKDIMVPAYIGKYSTIDLLNYLATLKAKDDASQNQKTIKQAQPITNPTPPVNIKGVHTYNTSA